MGVSTPATDREIAEAEKTDREAKILAIAICFSASLIEFVTIVDMCSTSNTVSCSHSRVLWPIWLGVMSILCCIVRFVVFRYQPTSTKYDMYLSFVLTTIWSFGVAFNTSSGGPFTVTNNGYFSCWIALIGAIYFSYLSITTMVRASFHVEISRQNKSLLVLFLASFVEMAVSADVCSTDGCESHEAVAVFVGIISSLVVGVHLWLVRQENALRIWTERALAPVVVVLWIVGAANNTSAKGPFTSSCDQNVPAANGYFSTWIAFYAAIHYSWAELVTMLPDVTNENPAYHRLDQGSHDQPYQPLSNDIDT